MTSTLFILFGMLLHCFFDWCWHHCLHCNVPLRHHLTKRATIADADFLYNTNGGSLCSIDMNVCSWSSSNPSCQCFIDVSIPWWGGEAIYELKTSVHGHRLLHVLYMVLSLFYIPYTLTSRVNILCGVWKAHPPLQNFGSHWWNAWKESV